MEAIIRSVPIASRAGLSKSKFRGLPKLSVSGRDAFHDVPNLQATSLGRGWKGVSTKCKGPALRTCRIADLPIRFVPTFLKNVLDTRGRGRTAGYVEGARAKRVDRESLAARG